MTGAFLALLGALFFAFNNLATHRGVLRVADTTAGVAISVIGSLPVLILALSFMGRISDIAKFPWQSYVWLLAAGIIHFFIGRMFNYKTIQLVGANMTGILRRSSPIVAVLLGVTVLGETVTLQMLFGILLVLVGVGFIGWNPLESKRRKQSTSSVSGKAMAYGLAAGVCYGISPVMIKTALSGFSSPMAGALISYLGASAVFGLLFTGGSKREQLVNTDGHTVLWFLLSGLLVVLAQISRYFALSIAPVSVVSPLFDISPVLVVILSFIFNRKLEVFSRAVILSTVIVAVGSFLILKG